MPKQFQLGISKTYLKGHPKAGQPTFFKEKIADSVTQRLKGGPQSSMPKIHTCRPNYEYWKQVEEKVNSGYGVLSLREWEGTPYKSKRPEFMQLTRMGVERLKLENVKLRRLPGGLLWTLDLTINDTKCHRFQELSSNDGFTDSDDLIHWLGGKTFHGCIIHFTDFRYGG